MAGLRLKTNRACETGALCPLGIAAATVGSAAGAAALGGVFGGYSAGIYGDASTAIDKELKGSNADTFAVSRDSYTITDDDGNVLWRDATFTISDEKTNFSQSFYAPEVGNFFDHPIDFISTLFGF